MKGIQLLALVAILVNIAQAFPTQEVQRLIKFKEEEPGRWLTQNEVQILISSDVNFMDITDHQQDTKRAPNSLFAIPSELRYQSTVQPLLTQLNTARIETFLTSFTAFHNRYYTAPSGVESSDFLFSEIERSIETSGYSGIATVSRFSHDWAQPSIIATLKGTDTTTEQIIVIGSHQDSVSSGAEGRAPGADDDGSGSASVLEAFTALLNANFIPKITVEFHWYAAEEAGLLGSQDVVAKYVEDGVEVVAMANFDMTGYLTGSVPSVGFITDYTDPELNAFLRKVVDEYLDIGWIDRTCGYACSDHAAWNNRGYKSAFPHEDGSNPYVHSPNDTVEHVQFSSILEFAKLAIGFAIEVSEPSNVRS